MDLFATNKMTDVTVCFLGKMCKDGASNEVIAQEVEYCIASGFVRIVTTETVYVTHISNVTLQTKA
jgi:hypothetical protein